MGKIIKFVDPDKPKNLKNINKNLGLGKAKPVNSTSKFDIHKKVKAKTNKDLANAYHEKYLKKKQELEDQIQKNITDNRGPKSKKELAKIQFDIRQVSYNNSTAEEKRNLDIERLIKLGATKPKKFQNYKEIMEEKKAAEKEFSEKLDGMSNEEKKILLFAELKIFRFRALVLL